jgi:hypothetical protein
MRWGTPKEYAEYHRICGSLAAPRFLKWLERENPSIYQQVLKEIGGGKQPKKRGHSEPPHQFRSADSEGGDILSSEDHERVPRFPSDGEA